MINLKLNKNLFNTTYLPYLMDYSHKYEVYYGGSGSGKSVFIAQKLVIKACASKRRIMVIRKTMASQRDSCWRLFLDLLSNWRIRDYVQVNKSDHVITFPNGSELLFKGLDDSEKIKSITGVTDVWCEEATELTLEDFNQLKLRVRSQAANQQFFISFNPISKANWVYKEWFDEDVEVPDDTMVLKTTYKDNRFLPDDYIQTLESNIKRNPTYYRIYALGEFCSLDKLVYNNWRVEEFDYRTLDGQLLVGLDFGFTNDPTAIVASIAVDKTIYVFKDYVAQGLTNDKIANVIKDMGFSKSVIIADSAEQKSIEEIRQKGISRIRPAKKGPDSVIHGIQFLQQYEIIVHPDCEATITELENYSWQKDKQSGEYLNKPIDEFNHLMDACRYSTELLKHNNKLKTVNKSVLGL